MKGQGIVVSDTIQKQYLGDGCYVSFDGYSLVVTTENGMGAQNIVVMEPDVYASLRRFAQDVNVFHGVKHFREDE